MSRRPISPGLPERHVRRNSPHLSVYASRRRRRPSGLMMLLLVLICVVVGAKLLATRGVSFPRLQLSLPHFGKTAPPLPVVSSLMASGTRPTGSIQTDDRVTLRWAGSRRTTRYRLQIAILPSGRKQSSHTVFRNVWRTVVTQEPAYAFRPTSPGMYYWRVQAMAYAAWGAYTRPGSFPVIWHIVDRPILASPRNFKQVPATVRLCWWPVSDVTGYYLAIAGRPTIKVNGTCQTVTVRPGIHTWRVAAFLRGSHTYFSSYSWPRRFTVPRVVAQNVARTHPARHTGGAPHRAPARVPVRQVPTYRLPAQQAPVIPRPVVRPYIPRTYVPPPTIAPAPSIRVAVVPTRVLIMPTRVVVVPVPIPTPKAVATRAPLPIKKPAAGVHQSTQCIPMFTC